MSIKLHVVFIDTTLTTPPTGGGQTFLVILVQHLMQQGWTISLVTQPGPEQAIVEALRKAGTNVIDDLWSPSDLPQECAEQLAAWVHQHRPDVYVVSITPDVGWLALPLLDENIGTMSIAHCDVGAFYDPVAHYHRVIDCAVGVSEEISRRLIVDCHMPEERVRHIPYGIEALSHDEAIKRVSSSADEGAPLKIGYIGRLDEYQKRVMDFVPLVAELDRRGVDFELHVIGDGEDRATLEQAFKGLAASNRVIFWGWRSPEEVKQHLLKLDVFLLMSAFEGLPVALLEAMGYALAPVVSGIASGNAQVVRDSENGYVVPIGDIFRFADRLETLARNQNLLRSMKTAAWQTSRDYSAERMVERYIDAFEHVTRPHFSREHRAITQPYPVMESCTSPYPFWLRKLKRRFLVTVNPSQIP